MEIQKKNSKLINYDASNRSSSIIAHICTWVKINIDHSILKHLIIMKKKRRN